MTSDSFKKQLLNIEINRNRLLILNQTILKYICYFDIFEHPINQSELALYTGLSEGDVEQNLNQLVEQGICFQFEGWYSIRSTVSQLVAARKKKENDAKAYFKKLKFYTWLIRSFPFVKGIGISGSLSKNVMHEDGDIDYFIITNKGRLWVCRTFLIAFKKIFLFNSKKYFCVNYFVDEDNLEIPDKNMFTAIEIAHILPVHNAQLMADFKKANDWTDEFIHSFAHPINFRPLKGGSWFGRFIGFLLKGKFGERVDLYLMRFTYKKWEKRFEHFEANKFELTMRTNRGVSKHHPRDFQNKVLAAYQERLHTFGIKP